MQSAMRVNDSPAAMRRRAMNAIELETRYSANNYAPLPVVLARGQGAHLWDTAGRRYVDMMSAYSAASHGHGHPRILAALAAQAERLAVPSRAYYSDRLGPFLEELCKLTSLDAALPMNTGAEAVETAIKAARRWGYRVKGIARDRAEIIVANGNFHGRTTTVVSASTEPDYRDGFGPFTPGFRAFAFGDLAAVERAITQHTAAVLIEPIQGEAGIIVPPAGWLRGLRRICDTHGVLLILDEVQSGLGRIGAWFAFQHEGIRPDGLILGKALGGGVLPVSAFVARREVMDVFTPGSHGSTFGGNPLAAAVGLEALHVIRDEGLVEKSRVLGAHMLERLRAIASPALKDVRGRGLWVGAEIDPGVASAREACERLLAKGVLSKETHQTVVRLAPPLVCGVNSRESSEGEATQMTMLNDCTARFLMCRPEHFAVSYTINPWMNPKRWGRDAGAHAAGLPDLVFTANAAVVLDRQALLARFRHPQRQREEAHFEAAFRSLQAHGHIDAVRKLPEGLVLEGAGDCVWDERRNLFWMGYGPRSDAAAARAVEDTFAREVVALELADPRFYHMDTALAPLPGGEVMYLR